MTIQDDLFQEEGPESRRFLEIGGRERLSLFPCRAEDDDDEDDTNESEEGMGLKGFLLETDPPWTRE